MVTAGLIGCRSDASVGDCVDDLRFEQLSDPEAGDAGEDDREDGRQQCPAAVAASEEDRERIEERDEDRRPQREALDELADRLDVPELVGVEQRERRDGWRRLRAEARRKTELCRDGRHDRSEIERDRALLDPDGPLAAVDDVDERLVGGSVRLRPDRLDPGRVSRSSTPLTAAFCSAPAAGSASGLSCSAGPVRSGRRR